MSGVDVLFRTYMASQVESAFDAAGTPIRVHLLSQMVGQVFSATAEAFNTTPAIGDIVEAQAGTKMKVVKTATSGSTQIGVVVDIEDVNGITFYVVRV